jgi:hypothetical protein
LSIVFLVDENPNVASAGLGGAAVGGARSVPDHAARSNSDIEYIRERLSGFGNLNNVCDVRLVRSLVVREGATGTPKRR